MRNGVVHVYVLVRTPAPSLEVANNIDHDLAADQSLIDQTRQRLLVFVGFSSARQDGNDIGEVRASAGQRR